MRKCPGKRQICTRLTVEITSYSPLAVQTLNEPFPTTIIRHILVCFRRHRLSCRHSPISVNVFAGPPPGRISIFRSSTRTCFALTDWPAPTRTSTSWEFDEPNELATMTQQYSPLLYWHEAYLGQQECPESLQKRVPLVRKPDIEGEPDMTHRERNRH